MPKFILSKSHPKFRVRRGYKDRLLIKLLQDRKELLSLYNVLNGSDYQNPEELIVTTLDDAVYMGMKNDCSFIIGNYLNLYEHQSTFCPNMPIRGLLYLVRIYEEYIHTRKMNLYGSTQIMLPAPKYVVLYNGAEKHEDIEYLRLSDAFEEKDSCLEFTAVMYNINMGHNAQLMNQCSSLHGYAILVEKVREYQNQGNSLPDAVDKACVYCMDHDILHDFLLKNRSEVLRVLLTEYNPKKQREMDRRDALAEGRTAKLISIVRKMQLKGILAHSCAEILEEDEEYIKKIYELLEKHPLASEEELVESFFHKRNSSAGK